jgi:hypothetical protein
MLNDAQIRLPHFLELYPDIKGPSQLDIIEAIILNKGFTENIHDGKPLFRNDFPFPNRFQIDADLSQAALEEAIFLIHTFLAKPTILIVSSVLDYQEASRFNPSADWPVRLNGYLYSGSWFLLTNIPDDGFDLITQVPMNSNQEKRALDYLRRVNDHRVAFGVQGF